MAAYEAQNEGLDSGRQSGELAAAESAGPFEELHPRTF
jgi:hypothetical protein